MQSYIILSIHAHAGIVVDISTSMIILTACMSQSNQTTVLYSIVHLGESTSSQPITKNNKVQVNGAQLFIQQGKVNWARPTVAADTNQFVVG